MAKKKVTRKELLKEKDEFITLSERAIIFCKDHARQFSYAGYAVLACILIYLGIHTYMKYVNRKAQAIYNDAYTSLLEASKPDADQGKLKQSEDAFRAVLDKYGLAKVSRLALPQLAHVSFMEGKYDEAIALYRDFISQVPEPSPYRGLGKLALAACYEEKGEYEKAIQTLQEIRDDPGDFLKEQSMLSQARLYRLANQQEKSREILKTFTEEFQSSPSLPLVKSLLNELT
jgi:outer membrane protein assembly factor BamD (BamD/ComL family)